MGPGRDILQVLENKEKFDKIQLNTVSQALKIIFLSAFIRKRLHFCNIYYR